MPKGAWIGRIILGIIVGAGILLLMGMAFLFILPALAIAIAALLIYHLIRRRRFAAKSGKIKTSQEILMRKNQYHTETDEAEDR